jgi:hypothetical protein
MNLFIVYRKSKREFWTGLIKGEIMKSEKPTSAGLYHYYIKKLLLHPYKKIKDTNDVEALNKFMTLDYFFQHQDLKMHQTSYYRIKTALKHIIQADQIWVHDQSYLWEKEKID